MSAAPVFESSEVSISRLAGRPRSGVDGRHKRLVAYVAADASTAEVVRLLREAAEGLSKSLPRLPE
jgi:hypothetical protein